ncbi:unnamed protein product, partial [marine sediment metagenome]
MGHVNKQRPPGATVGASQERRFVVVTFEVAIVSQARYALHNSATK